MWWITIRYSEGCTSTTYKMMSGYSSKTFSSKIKWAGLLSDPINIKQGVRQGGVLSTSHYKRYNNSLLLQLEDKYSDVKIGSINLPQFTVADDLAVMSRNYGSQQVKVWDVHVDNNTCRERYYVNPVKSSTLFYHFNNRKVNSECNEILLAGTKISNDQNTAHLGIDRTLSDRPCIEEKISLGRKTALLFNGGWIPQRKRA